MAEAPSPRTIPIRVSRDRPTTPRLMREQRTLEAMQAIWCRDKHGAQPDGGLCPACRDLMAYAAKRLAVCPYGEEKPVCAKCQIHCYGPKQREEVREVMRHSGPKMILRHPLLAIGHVLDKRYVAPPKPRAKVRSATANASATATASSPADAAIASVEAEPSSHETAA